MTAWRGPHIDFTGRTEQSVTWRGDLSGDHGGHGAGWHPSAEPPQIWIPGSRAWHQVPTIIIRQHSGNDV